MTSKLSLSMRAIKLIAVVCAVIAAYIWLWQHSFDNMAEILANPDEYTNKIVYLLENTYSVYSVPFACSIYKLGSIKNSMWVLSTKYDSTPEDKLLFIKGIVRTDINIKLSDLAGGIRLDEDIGETVLRAEETEPYIEELTRGNLWDSLGFYNRE